MTYAFDGYNYTLRFSKDELVVSRLKEFVQEQKIRGGWISGLGGLQWAELGFYNLSAQEYEWTKFEEPLELANMTGTIAWQDDAPALHVHATISDTSLHAHAGHLREAKTAGTVELFIHVWQHVDGLARRKDTDTGLNTLSL